MNLDDEGQLPADDGSPMDLDEQPTGPDNAQLTGSAGEQPTAEGDEHPTVSADEQTTASADEEPTDAAEEPQPAEPPYSITAFLHLGSHGEGYTPRVDEYTEQYRACITNHRALKAVAEDIIDNANQPFEGSYLICTMFKEVVEAGLENSYLVLYPVFERQWRLHDINLREALDGYNMGWQYKDGMSNTFPDTIVQAADLAIMNCHESIARSLMMRFAHPDFGRTSDEELRIEAGSNRRVVMAGILPTAILRTNVELTGPLLLQENFRLNKGLGDAIDSAMKWNKVPWLWRLLENLMQDKPYDTGLAALALFLPPDHPRVAQEVNVNRAKLLKPVILAAFAKDWGGLCNILLRVYLDCVADAPTPEARADALEVFDELDEKAYVGFSRQECFRYLKGILPPPVRYRILRRLTYTEPDEYVDQVTLIASGNRYKVFRDVLYHHCGYFRDKERKSNWINRYVIDFGDQILEWMMVDLVNYMGVGGGKYVASPEVALPTVNVQEALYAADQMVRFAVGLQIDDLVAQLYDMIARFNARLVSVTSSPEL
ncbi:hypothetical protein BJX70DRAFT_402736 [Aspergillus crustosus]